MNIEERLEAITQTLELVAGMQRDSEKRMDRLTETVDKILVALKQDSENIAALARIAQAHEHRLERLEGNS